MTGFPEGQLPEGWDALSRADEEALAPPADAKDRVRVHIAATLGLAAGLGAAGAASSAAAAGATAAAGVGAGSAPATVAGAAKALLVQKLVLGVVAVSAVTGGTAAYVEVRAQRQETARRAQQQIPARPLPPTLPAPAPAPLVEPAAPAEQPPPPAETLGDERALLDQARGAIARGRLAEAQALLARHAIAFPDGTLTEEREALQIRLLVRQGRNVEASHRAALFRRQHPHSIQLPVIDEALRSRR